MGILQIMDIQFVLSLNRLLNKFSVVLLMLCLFTNESKAQLEFSNWIIGKNTILHIDFDGKTQLINQSNIGYVNKLDNDNKNNFILSDNNGVPKITIGQKVYKYDNGLPISPGGVWKFDVFNSETVYEDEPGMYYNAPPFICKSPDSKYTYILHNTYSYEYVGKDIIAKTQFRCYCKNNFDVLDKGNDFVIHETRITQSYDENLYVMRPFFCALSHADGKSMWVIMHNNYDDKFIVAKLTENKIRQIRMSYINLHNLELSIHEFVTSLIAFDGGKIYCNLINNTEQILCLFFDQNEGIFTGHSFYDINAACRNVAVSATGKYLYYAPRKDKKIYRQQISDLENGIYNPEEISGGKIYGNTTTNLKIGIDGNIYVRDKESSISVIYDSESEKPHFESLYENISDSHIVFPNYLFPYETFYCAINCDKTAVFSYTDSKKEIQSILWNFGDGTEKSSETTPTHIYNESGKYTVKLRIEFADGQTKMLEREIVIKSLPEKPQIFCE